MGCNYVSSKFQQKTLNNSGNARANDSIGIRFFENICGRRTALDFIGSICKKFNAKSHVCGKHDNETQEGKLVEKFYPIGI